MAKVDICDKQQNRAFREVCHTAIMALGLDYWWNDGSRGQMSATAGQLVCNKTFYEEAAHGGRRGMLLARYGGLGSHRYGGFFTGDTTSDFDVLRLQCEFNIRAAGVGLSNISHDIGGFCLPASQLTENAAGVPVIDPERYLRWLQFGVFNPLLRFHSAPGCGSRRPDDYDVALGGACRHWLRVRHSLLPYLYTAMREYHDTGLPLTRGLFLLEPQNDAAYRFDEFHFGPALLVAPVLAAGAKERTLYLPAGAWWEFETGTRVAGGAELTRAVGLNDVPVYVRAGGILPRQDPDGALHAGHTQALWLDVYAGADGTATLYEDDGVTTAYRDDACCRTEFALTAAGLSGRVVAGAPLGAERRLTVTLAADLPPTAAVLNGMHRLAAEPLGARRCRFVLPALPAAAAWSLEFIR